MSLVCINKQPIFDNEPDLYEVLDVSVGASSKSMDEAYARLRAASGDFNDVGFTAWKVLRNRPYADLYRDSRSLKVLYDAGFIVDALPLEEMHRLEVRPGFLTTPFEKIASNVVSSDHADARPVVLVTTGAFSPVHSGHIAMLDSAKRALESRGRWVVGGYIAPSHDAYVSRKYQGEAALSNNHRIHLCRMAVAESPFWMVDPWKSRYLPTFINFTDLVDRLERYLNFHVPSPQPFEVFYVFGSDNARYARAFTAHHGCVCVARGNSEISGLLCDPKLRENPRIVLASHATDEHIHLSSTNIRTGQADPIRGQIADAYASWRRPIRAAKDFPVKDQPFLIRCDPSWQWLSESHAFDSASIVQAKQAFLSQLALQLQQSFGQVELPDVPVRLRVRSVTCDSTNQGAAAFDVRDVLLGADAGGCLVYLPSGETARVPCLEPYASIGARGSIPFSSELDFSIRLWGMNRRFFEAIDPDILIAHLSTQSQKFFDHLGFATDTSLVDLCQWHVDRLSGRADS